MTRTALLTCSLIMAPAAKAQDSTRHIELSIGHQFWNQISSSLFQNYYQPITDGAEFGSINNSIGLGGSLIVEIRVPATEHLGLDYYVGFLLSIEDITREIKKVGQRIGGNPPVEVSTTLLGKTNGGGVYVGLSGSKDVAFGSSVGVGLVVDAAFGYFSFQERVETREDGATLVFPSTQIQRKELYSAVISNVGGQVLCWHWSSLIGSNCKAGIWCHLGWGEGCRFVVWSWSQYCWWS